MKNNLTLLFIFSCLPLGSELTAYTANIYNDSHEQIAVRMRFKDQTTNAFYWGDWVHINGKASITSKKPEDSIFGFAMLGEQAAQQLSKHENSEEDQAKGIVYLVSDFRSTSNKHFSEIAQDARITIRDAKIEISATLPKENIYWTGEYTR